MCVRIKHPGTPLAGRARAGLSPPGKRPHPPSRARGVSQPPHDPPVSTISMGGQAAGGTDFTVAASANPTAGFPARRARPLVRHWLPSPHPTLVSGFLPGARENNSGKTALPTRHWELLGGFSMANSEKDTMARSQTTTSLIIGRYELRGQTRAENSVFVSWEMASN